MRAPSSRLLPLVPLALSLLVTTPGCHSPAPSPTSAPALVNPSFTPSQVALDPIENTFQLGPRLWSGGEPHGDHAFAALARAGIRTIVSVDGARTDLDAAQRHGLRYIHIPIGYDGIPPDAAAQLTAVADATRDGIFVHCHHGRHRGPAAAAILARANGAWDAVQATHWMQLAGTAPEYAGLYRAVADYRRPNPESLQRAASSLSPSVSPDDMVAAMVRIDLHAEILTDMKAVGWKVLDSAPDETPAQVARLLREQFTEGIRLGFGPRDDPDFLQAMRRSETSARDLEVALARGESAGADQAWKTVRENCTSCHRRWRNSR